LVQATLRRLAHQFEIGGTVLDCFKHARKVGLVVHIPSQRAVGFCANRATGIIKLVGG